MMKILLFMYFIQTFSLEKFMSSSEGVYSTVDKQCERYVLQSEVTEGGNVKILSLFV